ncbi:MAG: ParB/RepB/Spo0J family partition protein [Clostridia bacterium]|nr:ParB/RepB/Spo0J family partition protein [Clostridia bacterium]
MNILCKEKEQKNNNSSFNGKVYMLSTEMLFPNPSQPRFIFEDEPMLRLADSIRRFGILQPLSVRPSRNAEGNIEAYQIIAGERRWRAARILGLAHVPCLVLDIDSQCSAELALIENIQREDLNIFEQAAAIASLIDIYGLTQEQAARQLSSSQAYIANKLRILKLTPKERTLIIKNKLTERHARALLRIDNPETRLEAINHIASKELNVSAAERYIDSLLTAQNVSRSTIKPYLKDLRFFYNSVDKATSILKECGFNVVTEKNELPQETLITIRIPHRT